MCLVSSWNGNWYQSWFYWYTRNSAIHRPTSPKKFVLHNTVEVQKDRSNIKFRTCNAQLCRKQQRWKGHPGLACCKNYDSAGALQSPATTGQKPSTEARSSVQVVPSSLPESPSISATPEAVVQDSQATSGALAKIREETPKPAHTASEETVKAAHTSKEETPKAAHTASEASPMPAHSVSEELPKAAQVASKESSKAADTASEEAPKAVSEETPEAVDTAKRIAGPVSEEKAILPADHKADIESPASVKTLPDSATQDVTMRSPAQPANATVSFGSHVSPVKEAGNADQKESHSGTPSVTFQTPQHVPRTPEQGTAPASFISVPPTVQHEASPSVNNQDPRKTLPGDYAARLKIAGITGTHAPKTAPGRAQTSGIHVHFSTPFQIKSSITLTPCWHTSHWLVWGSGVQPETGFWSFSACSNMGSSQHYEPVSSRGLRQFCLIRQDLLGKHCIPYMPGEEMVTWVDFILPTSDRSAVQSLWFGSHRLSIDCKIAGLVQTLSEGDYRLSQADLCIKQATTWNTDLSMVQKLMQVELQQWLAIAWILVPLHLLFKIND